MTVATIDTPPARRDAHDLLAGLGPRFAGNDERQQGNEYPQFHGHPLPDREPPARS